MTETRILWDYLRQILIPARGGTGPYQDDYPISRSLSELTVVAAILAWVIVFSLAWLFRKRYPVVLFALLWFWAAHVIESTFIPLELYFEHRNYLAALGPIMALCTVLWTLQPKLTRIARSMLLLMIALNFFVLSQVTHLWGQPLLAATIWAEEHPQSLRATQYLARMHFKEGEYASMREVVDEAYARNPTNVILALQSLYLSCDVDSKSEFLSRMKKIESVLPTGSSGMLGVDTISAMADAKEQGGCPHLSYEHMQRLVDLLLSNKQAQANSSMAAMHGLKYRLYAAQGNSASAYQELVAAFSIKKGLAIALTAGRFAAEQGQYDEAIAFLERALLHAPAHPMLHRQWQQEIGTLIHAIKEQQVVRLKVKELQ